MPGSFRHFARCLLLTGFSLVLSASAWADINAFEFRLVEADVKTGEAVVAVRVVNKSTGQAVPDAVIFARRLDMEPEAMREMTAELEPLPPAEPGVYRFRTNFTMEGRWQLSLAAKVQGESGTLQARLGLQANK
ncbi:MAG: FixH family protein [Pseudomonadota bacterium]